MGISGLTRGVYLTVPLWISCRALRLVPFEVVPVLCLMVWPSLLNKRPACARGFPGTCPPSWCPTLGGRAHLTSLRARRRSPAVIEQPTGGWRRKNFRSHSQNFSVEVCDVYRTQPQSAKRFRFLRRLFR